MICKAETSSTSAMQSAVETLLSAGSNPIGRTRIRFRDYACAIGWKIINLPE